MIIKIFLLGSNPFFDAYTHSDVLGKGIILSLIVLSVLSWTILLHKLWLTRRVRRFSLQFHEAFQLQKLNPLSLECDHQRGTFINPFMALYLVLKKHTLELLHKNRRFAQSSISPIAAPNVEKENYALRERDIHSREMLLNPSHLAQPLNPPAHKESSIPAFLSPTDIDFVESHLAMTISNQTKELENNLFILSTTVSLAPFLGLLGTVWGILTTFSELQSAGTTQSSQAVIGGLSLALATTVLGLLDAIPALVGYNYLKASIRNFETEMEEFSHDILSSVELQYRKVDVHS